MLNAGIEGEVVRAVAASRYFSMLATASGEIWSFGGGFNGELGFRHSSWVTSAQKVEGQLAQVSLICALIPLAQMRFDFFGSSHDAGLCKLDTVNSARSHSTIQQDSSRGQSEVLETQCWDGVSIVASTVDCT